MEPNRAFLTKTEAEKIVNAQKLGHFAVLVSLDLGKSTEEVKIEGGCVLLRSQRINAEELRGLKEDTVYFIEGGELRVVELFSQETNLYYKLKPTKDWPTIMLSSVPMHRFRHISPKEDTLTKINEIKPVEGKVLDTCCGLGYTSICAAQSKQVTEVIVFERDENVLRICEYNPYSQDLFSNNKIKIQNEDVSVGIKKLKSASFDRVIHDPPTISFAADLYLEEFYKELYRVMKKNSILYHYCPNPGKTKGTEFWPRIKLRLEKVGFEKVEYHKNSSGIRAVKK